MITLNTKYVTPFLNETIETYQPQVNHIHDRIHQKTGKGADFLGWVTLPHDIEPQLPRILEVARHLQNYEVLVVIGIGGSYLGTKAGLHFLETPFQPTNVEIVFAGHNMSSTYLKHLLDYIQNKKVAVNVISKSGTTTEPALAFRLILEQLETRYTEKELKEAIVATTDQARGALYQLAVEKGYARFVIPDDVGGRYSVLSPVGLLPLAVAGYDIKKMVHGAQQAFKDASTADLSRNVAYQYAIYRYLLYKQGKKVEMLASYEPNMQYINEWWKQLFGESEGKENKGLFITSALFSTDLHSLGQYIQEGERHLFETIIDFKHLKEDLVVPFRKDDMDGLNYLTNKKVTYINQKAQEGTLLAHQEGGVPNLVLTLEEVSEASFGYLTYFFEIACAMSAYLIDINPFDQPGVEAYKKHMFALLGKPGYGDQH
jgi:glucose-6-phosphate isomerase